jgi:GTP-binding protein
MPAPGAAGPDDTELAVTIDPERPIRVAVVGRPNAGKSSLINRLLGADRVVVYDEPGTTRDPIDTDFRWDGQAFTLIDTAGIRRRGKMSTAIEAYSVVKALAQIDHCDVALTVIDGSVGPTEQDARVAGVVHDKGRAHVLVVTKWDLVRAQARTPQLLAEAKKKLDEELARKLGFVSYVPVVTVSSTSGEGVEGLPARIMDVFRQARRRVPTGELNRLFDDIQARHPPPSDKGRPVKLYFMQQARVAPPTFVVSANAPERVHVTYPRYLINQLRQTFGFVGVPVKMSFRKH